MRWRETNTGEGRAVAVLPDVQVQAVLNGEDSPDLPESYRAVALSMAAAGRLADQTDPGDETAARAAFQVARLGTGGGGRLRTVTHGGRIAVLSAVAVVAAAGTAAAATGHLPAPLQRDASHWLSHAGIHVPMPAAGRTTHTGPAAPRQPGPGTSTSPSTSTSLPSTTVGAGGADTTLPGATTLPGTATTLPNVATTLPAVKPTLPGVTTTLPGSVPTLPHVTARTMPRLSTTTTLPGSTATEPATVPTPTQP